MRYFYLNSFPRAGSNWLFNSLAHFLGAIRGEHEGPDEFYPHRYTLPGTKYPKWRVELPPQDDQLLALKSHQTFAEAQSANLAGPTIYLKREGKDCLLSFYFFTQAFVLNQEKVITRLGSQQVPTARSRASVRFDEDAFSAFLRVQTPRWREHVRGWTNRPGVHLVHYDDLLTDFSKVITRAAEFLDEPPVVEAGEVFRAHVTEIKGHFKNDNQSFHRSGKSGDWKHYFTREHLEIFETHTA